MMTPISKPVVRVTRSPFFSYGPDADKRFVAALEPGDVLTLRPYRSRAGASSTISVRLVDVYRWALVCRTNRAQLERAREKKKQKEETRRRRRLNRELRSEAVG